MSVTLSYTSKGLIDAIQRQLQQQKREGKISGDISYKSIVNCDFWSTLKTINDNHKNNNKIYHQRSYSCEDRGKPVDWRKTMVVYGSTKLSDDEWEMLVNAMGLTLSKKTEEAQAEKTQPAETPAEPAQPPKPEVKKEPETVVKDASISSMSVLLQDLKDHGLKDDESARMAQKAMEAGYQFHVEDDKLVIQDKQNNTIGLPEMMKIIEVTDMKNNVAE